MCTYSIFRIGTNLGPIYGKNSDFRIKNYIVCNITNKQNLQLYLYSNNFVTRECFPPHLKFPSV